eukprot:m51a1_g2372 hypothetical protein (696) ;mRNA; f:665843-668316
MCKSRAAAGSPAPAAAPSVCQSPVPPVPGEESQGSQQSPPKKRRGRPPKRARDDGDDRDDGPRPCPFCRSCNPTQLFVPGAPDRGRVLSKKEIARGVAQERSALEQLGVAVSATGGQVDDLVLSAVCLTDYAIMDSAGHACRLTVSSGRSLVEFDAVLFAVGNMSLTRDPGDDASIRVRTGRILAWDLEHDGTVYYFSVKTELCAYYLHIPCPEYERTAYDDFVEIGLVLYFNPREASEQQKARVAQALQTERCRSYVEIVLPRLRKMVISECPELADYIDLNVTSFFLFNWPDLFVKQNRTALFFAISTTQTQRNFLGLDNAVYGEGSFFDMALKSYTYLQCEGAPHMSFFYSNFPLLFNRLFTMDEQQWSFSMDPLEESGDSRRCSLATAELVPFPSIKATRFWPDWMKDWVKLVFIPRHVELLLTHLDFDVAFFPQDKWCPPEVLKLLGASDPVNLLTLEADSEKRFVYGLKLQADKRAVFFSQNTYGGGVLNKVSRSHMLSIRRAMAPFLFPELGLPLPPEDPKFKSHLAELSSYFEEMQTRVHALRQQPQAAPEVLEAKSIAAKFAEAQARNATMVRELAEAHRQQLECVSVAARNAEQVASLREQLTGAQLRLREEHAIRVSTAKLAEQGESQITLLKAKLAVTEGDLQISVESNSVSAQRNAALEAEAARLREALEEAQRQLAALNVC